MSTSDSDRPRLTLAQPPDGLRQKLDHFPRGWLWLLTAMNLAGLACLAVLLMRSAPGTGKPPAVPAATADDLRAVAVELENKSLDLQAARAWQAYLDAASEVPERAEIGYRIGKLYMQAQQYGEAAAALVRAEKAVRDDPDLAKKIGPQLVECLRRLGRYGEMGRELSRRVEAGGEKPVQGKVLATITGQAFTDADLDRLIERRVDEVMAVQGAGADPARREAILKQMSAPEVRRQLLQELIQSELFCRRARETGLEREESFIQAREHLEQSLLAGRFLSRELEKVRPTEVDLQSYYKANAAKYEEPESLDVLTIRLGEKDKADELLAKIASAEDFRKLSAQRAEKKADAESAPPTRRIGRKQEDPVLGNVEPLFDLAEGQWTKTPHVKDDEQYLVLVEKKSPARVLPFEQIARQVQADYAAVKQQELTQKLFEDLLRRYEVRLTPAGEPPHGQQKKTQ